MSCWKVSMPAAGRVQAAHGGVDPRHVVVDAAEHRLQVDRHMRVPGAPQALHPGVPEPAVADEAVHEHHAGLAGARALQPVGQGPGPEGLAPGEHTWRLQRLGEPGSHQLRAAGARGRVAPVHVVHQRELQAEEKRMREAQHQQARDDQCGRFVPRQRQPERRQREQPGDDELLQAGEHQPAARCAGCGAGAGHSWAMDKA
jgi:hypothetical protein